ncbi:tetratricopeptide repeat protein [Streptomyces sp. NPDC048825]|uniref:tetratricopeptide repeat protein n=1 Tax=Streptomyces sp. NPDC048825 TaxID=3365592 RepID=UPI003719E606
MTLAPATVEDTIEKNIRTAADRIGIQVRSAWLRRGRARRPPREQLGRFDEAIAVLEQALTVLRSIGDRWAEGIALDILGTAHHRLQRHDDAVAYFHQALDTHADIGNRSGEAHTLGNLGDVHLAADDPEAARTNWQQALAILEKVDHPDAEEIRGRLRRLEKLPPDARPDPTVGREAPTLP